MIKILKTKPTHLLLVSCFIYQRTVLTISGHDWQFLTGNLSWMINSWKIGLPHGFNMHSTILILQILDCQNVGLKTRHNRYKLISLVQG